MVPEISIEATLKQKIVDHQEYIISSVEDSLNAKREKGAYFASDSSPFLILVTLVNRILPKVKTEYWPTTLYENVQFYRDDLSYAYMNASFGNKPNALMYLKDINHLIFSDEEIARERALQKKLGLTRYCENLSEEFKNLLSGSHYWSPFN